MLPRPAGGAVKEVSELIPPNLAIALSRSLEFDRIGELPEQQT
jgi:hypothetical protein